MLKILANNSRQLLGEVFGSTFDDERYSVGGVDVNQVMRELAEETLVAGADTDEDVRVDFSASVGPEDVRGDFVGVPAKNSPGVPPRQNSGFALTGKVVEADGDYILVKEDGRDFNLSQDMGLEVAALLRPAYFDNETVELVIDLSVTTEVE